MSTFQSQRRLASIDMMRGIVMVLMIIDHASMAFDANHLSEDSALYLEPATLDGFAFFTRWITHICAPTFVLLAGLAMALSVEKKRLSGISEWEIDKGLLIRGAIIALLDLTLISLGSGRITLQVLIAIGVSMMLMAPLRRLKSSLLIALVACWWIFGEFITSLVWAPPGSSSKFWAFWVANYSADNMIIKYPILPWLSLMILGWILGRYMTNYNAGKYSFHVKHYFLILGIAGIAGFGILRFANGYGNMFLPRLDNSWEEWLHISKYPPSLTYLMLETGLMSLVIYWLMQLELKIEFSAQNPLLIFGQASMFFYLVHRLAFEIPATYLGLRGCGTIVTTYWVSLIALVLLYPLCKWYIGVKRAHPDSILKYF